MTVTRLHGLMGLTVEVPFDLADLTGKGPCYVGWCPGGEWDKATVCLIKSIPEGLRAIRYLHHEILHSPTGMSWGYHGSGPADLALSLLLDVLMEDRTANFYIRAVDAALNLHQPFKNDVVARLADSWVLPVSSVVGWLRPWVTSRWLPQEIRETLTFALPELPAEKEGGPVKAAER